MDRVKQVIYHGSIHEALIKNFITCHDILEYLLETPSDLFCMIAYRVVCQFDKSQIVNDKHFLCQVKDDNYVAIYALSVSDPAGRTLEETSSIVKRTQNVLSRISRNSDISNTIRLICDIPGSKLLEHTLWISIAARSTKLIFKYFGKYSYTHWLSLDYLEPLRDINYKKYEKELISRCNDLIEKAPLYWAEIARPLYQDLVSKNIDLNILDKDHLKCYDSLFPGLIPPELLNMSNFKYNIKKLPEISQAYLLGYPINIYVPSSEVLNKTISLVESMGVEKYAELIQKDNELYLNSQLDIPFKNKKTIGNTTDVLTEDISSYNIFDIVKYYIDTHVYYFTRAEFPKIMENEKNVWTNETLPLQVLMDIKNRLEICNFLKLPLSAPIKDLLKKIETGEILHEDSSVTASKTSNSIRRIDSGVEENNTINSNTFRNFFQNGNPSYQLYFYPGMYSQNQNEDSNEAIEFP